jgi:hypothetical protein
VNRIVARPKTADEALARLLDVGVDLRPLGLLAWLWADIAVRELARREALER